MPSNQTTNYQLSQWAKSDQVKMEDFNADNAKIDGALKAEAAARTALAAEVALRGNCQIYTTSYVGTGWSGSSHPNSLTFPKAPALVAILGGSYMALVAQGEAFLHILPYGSYIPTATWYSGGKTLRWYVNSDGQPNSQLNSNTTYHVIAFYSAES